MSKDIREELKHDCMLDELVHEFLDQVNKVLGQKHKNICLDMVNGKSLSENLFDDVFKGCFNNYYIFGADEVTADSNYRYNNFYCVFTKDYRVLQHTDFGGKVFPIEEENFIIQSLKDKEEFIHYQFYNNEWHQRRAFINVNNVVKINENLAGIFYDSDYYPTLYNYRNGEIILHHYQTISRNFEFEHFPDFKDDCYCVLVEVEYANRSRILKFFIDKVGNIASTEAHDIVALKKYPFDLSLGLIENIVEISVKVESDIYREFIEEQLKIECNSRNHGFRRVKKIPLNGVKEINN